MPQFTRAEAEALLPRVRPLLEDLKRRKKTYDERPSAPVASEIEALLREVAELGAEVKDIDNGLIDFRTDRNGEEVYLCWRLGEGDRIAWWHTLEGGFRGRRPLVDN
jgi:hypothetical protein